LRTAYSTDIRTGRKTRFQLSDADPENPYYNYIKMLVPWEHVFGYGRIVIVPYTRKSLVGGDICADFCSQVDLSFSQMQKVDDRYRSLDALQCGKRCAGHSLAA